MNQTLLAIGIGPVQEFIAASRKARDLWRGSSLLSEVSAVAAKALHDQGADVKLIFPSKEALAADAGIANKLLVQVTGDGKRASDLANLARAAAKSHLMHLWDDEIWAKINDAKDSLDRSLAEAQILEFLEFFAAWWPITAEGDGYKGARDNVERLLAGRKALRNFSHPTSRLGRAKSSLDPARDSIVKHTGSESARAQVSRTLHLSGAEQLDAISVMKRLGSKRRIISTSRIAIDPFLRRLDSDTQGAIPQDLLELQELASRLTASDLVEEFPVDADSGLEHFAVFPYDCQLFYGLPKEAKEASSQPDVVLSVDEQRVAKLFVETAERLREYAHVGAFPTSYAVLVADGDSMGKALGKVDNLPDHQAFSTNLCAFATDADKTVQRHFGALLYSGGDDVVAFLPTDTAIPCANALQEAFAQVMNKALGHLPAGERPTLSVGIAILHFREHLQVAMKWGRDAEQAAKKYTSMNALAVHLHTRSGSGNARQVVHSWDDKPMEARWARWTRLHRLNALPDSAAFDLRTLHRELLTMRLSDALLSQVVGPEVKRILTRKRGEGGTAEIPQDDLNAILKLIGNDLDMLSMVVDELLIARRLATSIDIAGATARTGWRGLVTIPRDRQPVTGQRQEVPS